MNVAGAALARSAPDSASAAGPRRRGGKRWYVCALLVLATAINYVDRQVIGILKPTLAAEFSWNERDYASIVFSFQLAYAIGLMMAGRVVDRLGTKLGYSLAIVIWSLAAMAHAWAPGYSGPAIPSLVLDAKTGLSLLQLSGAVAGFGLARFALGIGEAGNFPAAIKTVAEWFPKRERAFATGILNAGTNIGALLAPLLVPWLTVRWGWGTAFIATGVVGFAWLAAWWLTYHPPQRHPTVTAEELALIHSDPPEPTAKISWRVLLSRRQTWAFALGKLMTDPIWYLYLFWIPDFFSRSQKLDLKSLGLPLLVVYLVADVGSIGGGWLSSSLIRRGWSVNASRKTAMLICALCVVPIAFAARATNLWISVALISIAAAAHQGWSANIFTLVSDMFPRQAVGSVVGLGGMAGAVGGMVIALVVGEILARTGSYLLVLLMPAGSYLFALLVIQLLAPRLEPAQLSN